MMDDIGMTGERGASTEKDVGAKAVSEGPISFPILLALIACAAWTAVYISVIPLLERGRTFEASVLATFIAFMFIPLLLLKAAGRALELGRPDKGFIISMVVYQLFALWLVSFFWSNPDFFKEYELSSWEYARYLILVAFYVPPVDFFVRRVFHLEAERAKGPLVGFAVGTLVWFVGHALELVWLSALMGDLMTFLFILSSGVVTGLLYMRYKNIAGLMAGHWLLNLVVSVATNLLHGHA